MALGETCSFYSGTGFPNKYQGNTSGTYPFFKVGDISRNVQDGNVHLADAENYVEPDVVKVIKGTIIPAGTVVFAKIGEALRLNRRAVTTRECLVDNNVMGIKPDSSMLTEEYFFQFMVGLDMNEYSAATALPSVRKSTLEKVDILVPDIAAQNRFSELIRQSDKSKFTALMTSNINRYGCSKLTDYVDKRYHQDCTLKADLQNEQNSDNNLTKTFPVKWHSQETEKKGLLTSSRNIQQDNKRADYER